MMNTRCIISLSILVQPFALCEQDEAIRIHQQALDNDPSNATAHYELGMAFAEREEFADAIAHMRSATQLQPDNFQTHFMLGGMLCKIGEINHTIEAYEQVLKLRPNALSALYNIGYAHKIVGNLDIAIAIYKQVLARSPDYEQAHLALAFAYINNGDFYNGWREHEWNLKRSGKNADELRELLRTNSIAGKTILLRPEGGLGDTIQFVRYAQRLKELGATVIVAVQKPLIPLLFGCPYIDQLLQTRQPMPAHDAQATLMSLPAIFADDEPTIPRDIPYLFPDPELVNYWKERLAHDTNVKIGICWQSDVHNDVSRMPIARRGMPLDVFFKLKDIAGISLYSLQKKEGLAQLDNLPADFTLHAFDNFDEEHGNFMDTAAIMQHMDLIITIDSAVAHLAGALGRPVWLLLPYATDWRWMHNRTDSPWYPTMRIFKQPHPFDWHSVMTQVYYALTTGKVIKKE